MFLCVGKNFSRAAAGLALAAVIAAGVGIADNFKVQETAGYEWGLHFEKENSPPVPNLEDSRLNPHNAYYHGNLNKKVIYITFDAGYENGYTQQILDALKKHNAPACFFVVGPYIEENPRIVKRMAEEGHTVGNHSYSHPDMRGKSKEEFLWQLEKTEQAYMEAVGSPMPKFYRPPEGKFSDENLQWANEAGYTTVLWSSAYVDWNNDNQPTRRYAMKKISRRTFDGAIFLLHSTSATNARILDSRLTAWEQRGYTFGDIKNLAADYE